MKRKTLIPIKVIVIVLLGYLLLTSTVISASNIPLPITIVSKPSVYAKTQSILNRIGVQEEVDNIIKSKYFRPVSDQKYDQRQPVWPAWEVNTPNYILEFQGQTGTLLRFERKLSFDQNQKEDYLDLHKSPELSDTEAVKAANDLMKVIHPNAEYKLIKFSREKPTHATYTTYTYLYRFKFPTTLIGFISRDGAKEFNYYFNLQTTPNGQIIKSWLLRVPQSTIIEDE